MLHYLPFQCVSQWVNEGSPTCPICRHPASLPDPFKAPAGFTPEEFSGLGLNKESLPVTTEASDRGSRLTHPGDEGDWDLPTEPIQPESVSFKIFFF